MYVLKTYVVSWRFSRRPRPLYHASHLRYPHLSCSTFIPCSKACKYIAEAERNPHHPFTRRPSIMKLFTIFSRASALIICFACNWSTNTLRNSHVRMYHHLRHLLHLLYVDEYEAMRLMTTRRCSWCQRSSVIIRRWYESQAWYMRVAQVACMV